MGDLIRIDQIVENHERERRSRMAEALRDLALQAEKGDLRGVAFVTIPLKRENLSIGLVQMDDVALHELVGATTILNDYLRKAALDETE